MDVKLEIDERNWKLATARGLAKCCPNCGQKNLFASFITTNAACANCGTEFHHHRTDDAPPYFTIFIVGHIIVPALLVVEKLWQPDLWIHFAIWMPLTLLLSIWLLPHVKGALIGLQWAFRMHGFSGAPEAER